MRNSSLQWRFSANVGEARQATLCRPVSFEELVEEVEADVQVTRAVAEPSRDPGLNERVPARKILRHHEIHRFGFS